MPAYGGNFYPDSATTRAQASFYLTYGILGSAGLPPNNQPGLISFYGMPSVVNGPRCTLNAGPYYYNEVYQVTADSYYSYSSTVIDPADVTLWVSGLRTSLNRSGTTVFDSNEVQGQNTVTYRYPASGNATLIAGNYLQTSYYRSASGTCDLTIPQSFIWSTYWPANGQAVYLAPVSVTVSPLNATLGPAQTQQFTATVTGTSNQQVTWSTTPAGAWSISSSGLFTAPAQIAAQQTVTITATSVAAQTAKGSATVTLTPQAPTITSLSLPSGPPQMGFVVNGSNFGSTQGTITLALGGVNRPLTVISWGTTSATVQVPLSTPVGAGQVFVVNSAGVASNQVPFTVSPAFGCIF